MAIEETELIETNLIFLISEQAHLVRDHFTVFGITIICIKIDILVDVSEGGAGKAPFDD